MPIYEYRCENCGTEFSLLILSPKESTRVECTGCGSAKISRLMSRFAYHQTEGSRIDALDTSKPRGESFYRDNRNVGLWAKKRAKEMGVDLGSRFDDTVEKARTGRFMDDFDSS
jgi:putative FmdB family regulatory protein